MKTWLQVERRLERLRLPYRIQDETLVNLAGETVAHTVQGARDALASPGHPDSKRQDRCKQQDLARYGARVLKQSGVISCPVERMHKRREVRDMQRRMAEEQKRFALAVARRLQGRIPWPELFPAPPVPVDALALLAHLHQVARIATGANHAH